MNSACGRCHDNARCESMWVRMKNKLFYLRSRNFENYTMDELKTIIWHYFLSDWNNRRICSAIGGVLPAVKRRNYYTALNAAAWAFQLCGLISTDIHSAPLISVLIQKNSNFLRKSCKVILTQSYCQTDENYLKFKQIMQNGNTAISARNFSIRLRG